MREAWAKPRALGPQLLAHLHRGPPVYVTLKFDDNGSCRIYRVSDGGKEIVTNERYFVMPWKMVDVDGK